MTRRAVERLGTTLATRLSGMCSQTGRAPSPVLRAPPVRPPQPGYYDTNAHSDGLLDTAKVRAGDGILHERVRLRPHLPAELRAVPLALDPIEIHHYRPLFPRETPAPLVLMSPILGNTLLLVDGFARSLATAGLHAAIVQRKELAFHPEDSLRLAEEEVRTLILRSRQALDHLIQRRDVDERRMGTLGISAGGVVSSMLAGVEPRLGAHVWMLAGGPLPDVLIDTAEDRFRGYARTILTTTPRTRAQLRRELRGLMVTDPIRLAGNVDPEGVLLVLARFDRSVPYRYGLALWRALGKPDRILSPLGHYSTFLLLPWLKQRTLSFFCERFSWPVRAHPPRSPRP